MMCEIGEKYKNYSRRKELYELFEYFVEVPEWPVKKVQT